MVKRLVIIIGAVGRMFLLNITGSFIFTWVPQLNKLRNSNIPGTF